MESVYYSIVDKNIGFENVEKIDSRTLIFSYPCNSSFNCTPYKVILPRGLFQIECYGAGNTQYGNSAGGGYTSGIIEIKSPLKIYLYLGAQGEFLEIDGYVSDDEVFNGGGGNLWGGHSGSGATDIRLEKGNWKEFNSLRSRIMVAGGAGGSECGDGGAGGGLNGGSGKSGTCKGSTINAQEQEHQILKVEMELIKDNLVMQQNQQQKERLIKIIIVVAVDTMEVAQAKILVQEEVVDHLSYQDILVVMPLIQLIIPLYTHIKVFITQKLHLQVQLYLMEVKNSSHQIEYQ